MFTGIVEHMGVVAASRLVPGGRRLRIDAGPMAAACAPGSSMSVSGVCLTVAGATGSVLDFDVVTETLERSTLGSKRVADHVNLERSLCVGDRLDGHFVQGHVDGTAVVDRMVATARENVMWFRASPEVGPCLVPKGSVAVDGVSLTIAAVARDSFSVALIPTTLDGTTLPSLTAGDAVNIETDILVRTVVHYLSHMSGSAGLTLDALRKAGFA